MLYFLCTVSTIIVIQTMPEVTYCHSISAVESSENITYSPWLESNCSSKSPVTLADNVKPASNTRRNKNYKIGGSSPYIPLRLTDPSTSTIAYSPRRLTDSDSSAEPKLTTYHLSVSPVTLLPEEVKTAEEIHNDCVRFEIIPDLLSDANTPPNALEVRFLFELLPEFGNTLDPKDLIYRPYYVKWAHNSSSYYTLLMLDIDYPCRSHPYMRSWKHWMVVNIRGGKWIDADVWAEYVGPNPHFGSGFHRYVFLLFQQPDHIYFDEFVYPKMRLDDHRANFSVDEFRDKYKLVPVGINFFQAQWMSDFVYP